MALAAVCSVPDPDNGAARCWPSRGPRAGVFVSTPPSVNRSWSWDKPSPGVARCPGVCRDTHRQARAHVGLWSEGRVSPLPG